MIGSLVGMGLGLVGSFGKLLANKGANDKLKKLQGEDPILKNRLGLATTMLNARQPGSVSAERNTYSAGAGQNAGFDRNATDANSAIFAKAGTFGQQLNQFNQLGLQEAQGFQQNYQNYVNEQDKIFQDDVRRFQDSTQIEGAIAKNKRDSWGSIANAGFAMADFGMNGGFGDGTGGGLFGGKGGWKPSGEGYNSNGTANGFGITPISTSRGVGGGYIPQGNYLTPPRRG